MSDNSGAEQTGKGQDLAPIRSEIVDDTGSMGRIVRLFYSDGTTRINKVARNSSDNASLQNEYKTLSRLSGLSKTIPVVYREFPVTGTGENYSFQMEDLTDYQPLVGGEQDTVPRMSEIHKLIVLQQIAGALRSANDRGILQNDVQLRNVMVSGIDVRMVDWANTRNMTNEEDLADVNQFKQFLVDFFVDTDFIPKQLLEWRDKHFKKAVEAWNDLISASKNISEEEIAQLEKMRAEAFGPPNN